jgi:transposase
MFQMDKTQNYIMGSEGRIPVLPDDEITRKLAMLVEGQCEGVGATKAAQKYGYTRQRYSQLLQQYVQGGALALKNQKRGPKRPYRRTNEVIRLVIRHRYLDRDASAEVIAQKLRQCGWEISTRSVERIIASFGLQKKTPPLSANE